MDDGGDHGVVYEDVSENPDKACSDLALCGEVNYLFSINR
jgi:hypothetical protein